jgi:hypothetical protein
MTLSGLKAGFVVRTSHCISFDLEIRNDGAHIFHLTLSFRRRMYVPCPRPFPQVNPVSLDSIVSVFALFFYVSTILVHAPPAFALWTTVAMKAIPSTPSSTVGKSQSGGIAWPLTSASIARAAST